MGDERYCYQPEGRVLINKLDIREQKKLDQAETAFGSLRQAALLKRPVKGNFDLAHLCAIHKRLFGDVYKWAGQTRDVNIAKGNLFCPAAMIADYAAGIFADLKAAEYLHGLDRPAFIRAFARFYGDVNCLHPFREGNGRATREFFRLLALENGYALDLSGTSQEAFIRASIDSFAGKNQGLEAIFEKALQKFA